MPTDLSKNTYENISDEESYVNPENASGQKKGWSYE